MHSECDRSEGNQAQLCAREPRSQANAASSWLPLQGDGRCVSEHAGRSKHLLVRSMSICLDMQLSRSALTFIAQKTSAQPQPCKRCSQRLRNKRSGDIINVYHGEPHMTANCCWHQQVAHAARLFPALHMSLGMFSQFRCTGPRNCYVTLKHGVSVTSCSSWHHQASSQGSCLLPHAVAHPD